MDFLDRSGRSGRPHPGRRRLVELPFSTTTAPSGGDYLSSGNQASNHLDEQIAPHDGATFTVARRQFDVNLAGERRLPGCHGSRRYLMSVGLDVLCGGP
jgi:hypothetical protein